jgi:hypothetical protein
MIGILMFPPPLNERSLKPAVLFRPAPGPKKYRAPKDYVIESWLGEETSQRLLPVWLRSSGLLNLGIIDKEQRFNLASSLRERDTCSGMRSATALENPLVRGR